MAADATFLRHTVTCALFAMAIGCGGSDPANEEATDDTSAAPIIGGSVASAYPEAVLVDMYQSNRIAAACSGSLVAPKVVLTAGHCVDGFTQWRITAPYAGKQQSYASGAAVYDWKSTGESVDPSKHDVALVFLQKAITLSAYPTLAASPLANGAKAVNVGRIDDGTFSSTNLFVGKAVSLYDATNYGFPYDYISRDIIQSGDSGGPVEASGHVIVAVNSGAGGSSQVLARVDLLRSWITQQIAAHP